MKGWGGRRVDRLPPYRRYDDLADASAALVIRSYSSSFGLASRVLPASLRRDIGNIYALVRVADEIVDAPRPDQDAVRRRADLDDLQGQLSAALATGSSSNLVVHAFARTARRVEIDESLTAPFFDSMRTDLDRADHDAQSLAAYIHGSAEVVGLMCLRVFVAKEPDPGARYRELALGARHLGAAFQKINFLRDLGEDADDLGRRYLLGLDPGAPNRSVGVAWQGWLDEIDDDLRAAAEVIPLLPADSRTAVCVAHDLFGELSRRLRRTRVDIVRRHRVRVPTAQKLRITAAAVVRRGRPRQVAPR